MTSTTRTARPRPKSLATLNKMMREVFTADTVTDCASVHQASAIDVEAGEYDIEYRLGRMTKPVLRLATTSDGRTTVLMRCSILNRRARPGQDDENSSEETRDVHPVLAAYFERFDVIDRLSRKLLELDADGRWDGAEAVAQSLCEVLTSRSERGTPERRSKREWLSRGRLGIANRALAEKLRNADRSARDYEEERNADAELSASLSSPNSERYDYGQRPRHGLSAQA